MTSKNVVIEYVLDFIEDHIDEWYEYSTIGENGEYIVLEFDVVAKKLAKLKN